MGPTKSTDLPDHLPEGLADSQIKAAAELQATRAKAKLPGHCSRRYGDDTFENTFFVEVDRSTETQDALARGALCYLDYYRRGGLAEPFGHDPTQYKDFPFRVLMIFKTAERRNNAAERLLLQNHQLSLRYGLPS
jgi:hypothetical protein